MKRALALLALIGAAAANAQAPDPRLGARILAIHNRERALVGVPPLTWSARLAAEAATYAPRLAARGRLEHSRPEERAGQGENLAMGTLGPYSAEDLVGFWVAEKRAFRNGVFPDVSMAGGWQAVGHYTTMIWRGTTSVGCAAARGGPNLYLVCRYAPAGNVIGRRVY